MKRLVHGIILLLATAVAVGCQTSNIVLPPGSTPPGGGLSGSYNPPDASVQDAASDSAGGNSATNYFVQCAMQRTEVSRQNTRFIAGTTTLQAYFPKEAQLDNYRISRAALCTFGKTDQASVDLACKTAFCTKSGPPGWELADFTTTDVSNPLCTASGVANTLIANNVPPGLPRGLCTTNDIKTYPDQAQNVHYGQAHAKVTCSLSGRFCNTVKEATVTYCSTLNAFSEPIQNFPSSRCFDPSVKSGYDYCANSWNYHTIDGFGNPAKDMFKYVQLEASAAVVNESPDCTANLPSKVALAPNERAYGLLPSGVIGSVAVAGQSAQLIAKAGYAVVETYCGNVEGPCTSTRLSRMKLSLQDTTVLGIQFANPTVELQGTAETTPGFIAPGTMNMIASAGVLGTNAQLTMANTQQMSITADSSNLALSGQVTGLATGLLGDLVQVTVTVNVSATTSSPGAGCVGLTRAQEILGFELAAGNVGLWQSSQSALAVSSRTPTQGCYAVDVPGNGYRVLNSVPFATPLPGTTSTLGLDFFVPADQPNPYWLGAVQMYATCPSANMNNAYIGQVELTGKPVGAYSTLTFPIPAWIDSVLTRTHSDCFFSIAVNANQTPTPPTLDNLRFLP